MDPLLNPCSLLNNNEQGKETRVPELSEEEGTIVCEQGGQQGDTRRVTLNRSPGGRKRSSHLEIEKGSCQPAGTKERADHVREEPGLRPEQLEARACFLRLGGLPGRGAKSRASALLRWTSPLGVPGTCQENS